MRSTPRSLLIPALIILFSGAAFIYASDGYTALQNTPVSITGPDGVCKKITNLSGTGLSEYIPTASISEWQSFVAHPPIGVTLASCAVEGVRTLVSVLPATINSHTCAESSYNKKIYCFTGAAPTTYVNKIYEFDPATGIVATKTASAPSARKSESCAGDPVTGKIYCAGGTLSGVGGYTSQIFEYNPQTDTVVTKGATLLHAEMVTQCNASSANQKIYCIGGTAGITSNTYANIDEYTPGMDARVTKTAQLPGVSSYHACAASTNGKIYCFGGFNQSTTIYKTINEYNPLADTMTTRLTAAQTMDNMACAASPVTGKIYCFGGAFNSSSVTSNNSSVYEYDPVGNTFATRPGMTVSARAFFSCVASTYNDKIYCFGGMLSSGTSVTEIVEYTPPSS